MTRTEACAWCTNYVQVAIIAMFGHFGRAKGITRRITRRATRLGAREGNNTATCIGKAARDEFWASGLASRKASPSSPTPTASALEAQRPATLAGYPSAAAVAKPFSTRGSFAACTTDYVHAASVLVESSACQVAFGMTEAALQPELSKHSFASVGSSMLFVLHLPTIL